MMGLKRITIAQYERGVSSRNRSFEAVMEPGVHWLFDPLNRCDVKVYDVAIPEFEHPRVDVLITDARALIERYLMIVELGDREVGLVYKNDRLVSVLAPGKRQLYWRGPISVRVDVRDISREFALDADTARVLMRVRSAALNSEAIGVADGVILTGKGEKFQLWNPARWQARKDADRAKMADFVRGLDA